MSKRFAGSNPVTSISFTALVWPSGKAFVLYFDNFLKRVFHTLKKFTYSLVFLSRALDEDDTGATFTTVL